MSRDQKLALVLVVFVPVTDASKKNDNIILHRIQYIYYLLCFCNKNKKDKMQILINFSSEINLMTLTYVAKLGLKVYQTNVKA